MSEPIDPARPVNAERRRTARRHVDPPPPPSIEGERVNFPAVIAAQSPSPGEPSPARAEGPAIYAAQIMGQDGQKRGLRGGAPVLNQARSAYLATEYSGPSDRRPSRGRVTRTEI